MSILSAFPSIRPTLSLDFAKVKALDPRITFTRASTATYYDAEGVLRTAASGEARFTHDPATEESLGLLIEEARTNLFTYSEQFDNAAWTKLNVTVNADAAVSPDGLTAADAVIATTTNASHFIDSGALSFTSGTTYTQSIYAKALGTNRIRLRFNAAAFTSISYVDFDLVSGSIVASSGLITASSITSVGNGWYRCTATAVATATATNNIYILILDAVGTQTYAGNGYSGAFLWGAQIEAGAFPTSYIPTTSSQVTRAADVASMTGTNFSSWYNAENAGSVYVEANETFAGSNGGPWWLHAGFSLRGIAYRRYPASNTLEFGYRQPDGALRTTSISDVLLGGQNNKVAVSFDAANSSVCVNGASATTSSSSNLYPAVDQMRIGYAAISGSSPYVWCGTIKKLAYYPARLPNGQLQALTA